MFLLTKVFIRLSLYFSRLSVIAADSNRYLRITDMSALVNSEAVKALLETASKLAESERSLPTPINNIQIAYDIEASTATVAATLPFTPDTSAAGLVVSPTDYAPVTDFDAAAVTVLGAVGSGMANAPLASRFLRELAFP